MATSIGVWAIAVLHSGCGQNYGPLLGTLNIRCRITIGIQKRDHNFDNYPYCPPIITQIAT